MRHAAFLLAGLVLLAGDRATAQTPASPPQPRPMPAVPGMPRDRQPDQKVGTAVLSGRVLAADTGKPVRRALVRVSSAEAPQPRTVSTDADGRWQMKALPAGSYRISVSKGGYVEIGYGQQRPFEGGRIIEVADGQAVEKLEVSLPRAGVITGRVVDEFGEPITNARVVAMRYRYAAGQRRLFALGPGDTTDDIGQFRLHGLSPGEYYVSAALSPGLMFGQSDDREGYGTTYYPGTGLQGEAQRVSVTVGQETPQINFAMVPMRVATVSGTAVTSSGKPIVRGSLMLVSSPAGGSTTAVGTQLKPDGSFLFSNVAPGEYRIQVQHTLPPEDLPPGASAPRAMVELGSVSVNVTGPDITGISIVTSPGGTASGRVLFDGGVTPSFAPTALNISATSTEFLAPMVMGGAVRVREDWTWEATGLMDRRRFRLVNLPGWYTKAVTYEGADITDTGMVFKEGQHVSGIDIVLTQRATEIAGSVLDSRGRPATDYVVVAYARDSDKWGFMTRFVRSTRPNQDGGFSIKGLPPDEYHVVALDYMEPGEETDPEQLEKWRPLATSLALSEGEVRTVTLKLR